MRKMVFLLMVFWSCTSCNSNDSKSDLDIVPDLDSIANPDSETADEISDEKNDENSDMTENEDEVEIDSDTETSDVDMYCPLPMDAKYPYYRQDGTIHFCRPCDKPDEYDPQCVKSLWKDLNKEVYDSYKNGEFENNEYVAECYPWPCEWNVTPRQGDHAYAGDVMKCDLFINPWNWATSFSGFRRESNMDGGKIIFRTDNYRIGDKKPIDSFPGYAGQRAVLYDIKTGKYEVIAGTPGISAYMNGMGIISAYTAVKKTAATYNLLEWIISMVPYKGSYKYSVIYQNENNRAALDVFPYTTDKWTIMVINNHDVGENTVSDGNRSLVYAKTGEWKWTTLAYGNPDGKADELSISGNRAMFYHYGTNASWVCDLSKNPKKITDCKRIGKENEVAGFPKFDLDNPDRIIYRPIAEGIPYNHFVIMDISKEPWTLIKELNIPTTEKNFINLQLAQVRSNVILYKESYQMEASGYQTDGKLCYYRIDKEKVYCSKPIEGQTSYGHGFTSFEGKYLFWQPAYKAGYILRDMDCYCKEEGVCPFEE